VRAADKKIINSVVLAVLLIVIFFVVLFPIYFTIQNSFKNLSDIFSYPPRFLFEPTWENWRNVLLASDFIKFYVNSLIIATTTNVIVLFAASLAGYALARFKIRKKEDLAFWILSNSMMPPIAIILPLYILFSRARLLDTYVGIIIVFTAFNLPFAIWLMRSFFEDLPIEMEEAALVDGATRIGAFFRVTLPLVKPGIVACAIYTFVMCINEFFFAFVLTGSRVKPAAAAILNYLPTGVRGTLYGQAAVASILIMIPAVLLFILLQKHFIRGMTFGAIKG
jgi:multiple sugar transport system permease protein